MSAHDQIQPNGTCWDCGRPEAWPVANKAETQTTIGWRCECGRYWPALGKDVGNWARHLARLLDVTDQQIRQWDKQHADPDTFSPSIEFCPEVDLSAVTTAQLAEAYRAAGQPVTVEDGHLKIGRPEYGSGGYRVEPDKEGDG